MCDIVKLDKLFIQNVDLLTYVLCNVKKNCNIQYLYNEKNKVLDLIFTNEDYMIENLKSIAPQGKVIMLDWCGHSVHTRL